MSLRQFRVFRGDQDTVSPIIGEVLMVAIVVVLATVTYISVSGMLMLEDDDRVSISMTHPEIKSGSRGASPTLVWDVNIDITKVTPEGQKLHWDRLFIDIRSSNGSVLLPKSPLNPDDPAIYDNDDSDGIDVEFWFMETMAGDTVISGGDAIKVTGMDLTYEGATIQLTKANDVVGRVTLGTNFQ